MTEINEVLSNPDKFFASIEENYEDSNYCFKLIKNFSEQVPDKSAHLDRAKQFIAKKNTDRMRSWGIAILEEIGKDKNADKSIKDEVFKSLVDLIECKYTADSEQKERFNLHEGKYGPKKTFRDTRFFAISAMRELALSDAAKKKQLENLLGTVSRDDDESYLAQAEAFAILAEEGDNKKDAEDELRKRLQEERPYFKPYYTLRALEKIPLPVLTDDIIKIINTSRYDDYKYWAIKALGNRGYPQDSKIIRALGDLATTDRVSHLRLEAIKSITKREDKNAFSDLLRALEDENAEVRAHASRAIKKIIPKEKAVRSIVERALQKEIDKDIRSLLTRVLRDIDEDGTISSQILSRILVGEDKDQAQTAREMLIDLGGWAAIQSVSQRRTTLGDLDKLLTESEAVVKDTFQATIHQARINFYFALIVNALIVIMGLSISTIAIVQLSKDPETGLGKWVLTGAAGLFGVIINMYFNDPRKNAREDLTALMNVNVIFLGFLRQLNEIDATFKHAYLEKQNFGKDELLLAVEQIKLSIDQTLNMTARHLGALQKEKNDKGPDNAGQELEDLDKDLEAVEDRVPTSPK